MNIQSIVREIKRENECENRRIKNRIKQAAEEIERLKVDFLKIDKNMGIMILFGSLAKDNIKALDFDIDVAVKSKKYYQLVSRALESEFKIDVIDLDVIHKEIKKSIMKNGKVIHEKREN